MAHLPRQSLLALLDAFGGELSKIDFQKLLFLYCQDSRDILPYDFVPYKFGAFSLGSAADQRKLVSEGFVLEDDTRWRLTPAGEVQARRGIRHPFASFAKQYPTLRGEPLVAETYRRFPYYAIRSQMAERLFSPRSPEHIAIEQSKPKKRSGLSTVGYQGKSVEVFLNQLLREAVAVLIDVRRNPVSRKYGFARSTLEKACAVVGIAYEHRPELGIASDERKNLDTQADYERLFRQYEIETLPAQQGSLDAIKRAVEGGSHVALTCFEDLPAQCHRSRIAAALQRQGISVVHL